MNEEALNAAPAGEGGLMQEPPPRRIVTDMPSWVPTEKLPVGWLISATVALLAVMMTGTTLPFVLGWVDSKSLEAAGYAGIFLTNFFATAAWFVPVPPVAGQAAIVAGSQTLFKPGVVIAGSLGMTLAESTAYIAGVLARGVTEERRWQVGGRLGRLVHRSAGRLDWLMARYGFLTLAVLAGVPNPVFEFAGMTAGAVRMNFWRFLIAVGIGKTIRVILLVILGNALLDLIDVHL